MRDADVDDTNDQQPPTQLINHFVGNHKTFKESMNKQPVFDATKLSFALSTETMAD